ncbi:MAG TPA: hypothetical protein VMV29_16015 [Ktedonobacterales bacterium]|nr:hypothetical protein [Ktedonobacterales bacterium]
MNIWSVIGDIASIITIVLFAYGVIRWLTYRRKQTQKLIYPISQPSASGYATSRTTAPTATPKIERVPNPGFQETAWGSAFAGAIVGGLLACIGGAIWLGANDLTGGGPEGIAVLAVLGMLPATPIGSAIGLAFNGFMGLGKAIGFICCGILFCSVGLIVFFVAAAFVLGLLVLDGPTYDGLIWVRVIAGLVGYVLGLWGAIALFGSIS